MFLFSRVISADSTTLPLSCICQVAAVVLFAYATAYSSDTLNSYNTPANTIRNKQDSSVAVSPSSDNAPVVELDRMVVTASRRERLMETAQSLTVVKSDEWVGTNKSIADVIAEQTGVQTRKFGGTGSFQTVSVRGVQGAEVLVLLDGIPLNSAMGGAVDLSAINPERIEAIEIYKSIVPSRFGGNSIGGVINLKSLSTKMTRQGDVDVAAGAYGYLSTTLTIDQPMGERIDMIAWTSYTSSDNDWPYNDRNNTPYNTADDVDRKLENHEYSAFQVRLQPELKISDNYRVTAGAAYSASSQGIPADEGHTNHTAQYGRKMFDVILRMESDKDDRKVEVLPEISFLYLHEDDFWTSIDESMGTSHGGFSSSKDSWGKTDFILRTLNAACHVGIQPLEYAGIDVSLSGQHSDAKSETHVTGFPHGDWPGEMQTANLATEANIGIPINSFKLGATLGGSITGVRSKTEGGWNDVFKKNVPASDTIDLCWSARGGLSLHCRKLLILFGNAGRYSDLPDLREKYGTKGAVAPNPNLLEETGLQMEAGIRLLLSRFYVELAAFRVQRDNSVFLLSDGNMSVPVNLGGALIKGMEWTSSVSIASWATCEFRGTFQNAENQFNVNNWYGNELPNEPPLSLLGKVILGPFAGIKIHYWVDYKSAYYRDFANTGGQRVPEGNRAGLVFHNAMLEWKAPKRIECRASMRNISGISHRYEETTQTIEGGYSWILYPKSEWCVSMKLKF